MWGRAIEKAYLRVIPPLPPSLFTVSINLTEALTHTRFLPLQALLRRILLHEEVAESLRRQELDYEARLAELSQSESSLKGKLKELQITGDDVGVRKAVTFSSEGRLAEARAKSEERLKVHTERSIGRTNERGFL